MDKPIHMPINCYAGGYEPQVININPVSKPRMTQRDKWAKRPCVLKYFKFRDDIRAAKVNIPEDSAHIKFFIPMPKSWSKKKKLGMMLKPHQQRPDVDNLLKAILDAVFDEDCRVFDIRVSKYWSDKGSIVIH